MACNPSSRFAADESLNQTKVSDGSFEALQGIKGSQAAISRLCIGFVHEVFTSITQQTLPAIMWSDMRRAVAFQAGANQGPSMDRAEHQACKAPFCPEVYFSVSEHVLVYAGLAPILADLLAITGLLDVTAPEGRQAAYPRLALRRRRFAGPVGYRLDPACKPDLVTSPPRAATSEGDRRLQDDAGPPPFLARTRVLRLGTGAARLLGAWPSQTLARY